MLHGALVRLRGVDAVGIEIERRGTGAGRAELSRDRLVEALRVGRDEHLAAGELLLEVAVDLAADLLRGGRSVGELLHVGFAETRIRARGDDDAPLLDDVEDEVVDGVLRGAARLEADLGIEEAVLDVVVAHLLDEVVRRAVGLRLDVEELVEGRLVVVVVALVARLVVRAEVDAHAERDEALVEDDVVRDVGAVPAAAAEACLQRRVRRVEHGLVGAVSRLHAIAPLGVVRLGLRASERIDDAALDATRRAGDDVDDDARHGAGHRCRVW